ncbi:acyltransferase family protein [Pacificoceanicola onchidii]|uniref:acyltransferase family protein n=1 Tax=Pacificoceanicola onchidii TaxID=2562685 RepID=UPI00197E7266|nr:acyltransferase family protein [Pacificoceanicola onchidii]
MSAPLGPAMPYRGDIDGLRAVAVLGVVLYHFGLPIPGGFVGVDVFFVISGFLIGGILWREYDQTGRVWLKNFYTRRFRRLAPAFFVMAIVTTLVGWALMLPFEFREYGKTLVAATVYLSNVLFFRSAGYFDVASEDKPLLHTWSLAVEEQFYIVLPLLILLFARWRWGLLGVLITIWAASLAGCILLTPGYQTATFYLFPFRAWELLSGVLLAIWGYETGRRWRGWAILSWLGAALILGSMVFIPAGPHFPGLLAIPPVLGTVLIIANGFNRNPVNQILCSPAALFFGAISYSLYLWHWPVFTLSTYFRDGYANIVETVFWMTLSVGLAWISWRFVENPVRHAQRLSGGLVMTGTALASAITLGIGGWLYTQDGVPSRFGAEARTHINASGDFLQDWSRCYVATQLPLDGLEVCPIGPDGPARVLVWGDSHVRAFKEGLDLAAHEAGVPGVILWRAGCPPLFGVRKVESAATAAQDLACTQANKQIEQSFMRLNTLEAVLLIGRWSYYSSGQGVGLDKEHRISLHPTENPETVGAVQARLLANAARETVAKIALWVPNLFVLRQPPEIPLYDSREAARETAHAPWPFAAAAKTEPTIQRSALALRAALADAPWQLLQDNGQITFLDTWPYFCDADQCSAVHDGIGQYFDNNHLTNAAALRVRDVFAPVFAAITQQTARSVQVSE